MRYAVVTLAGYLVVSVALVRQVSGQQVLPCPAVDAQGHRPKLNPAQAVFPKEQSGDRDIDEDIAKRAIQVLAFFESDGGDPWATISTRETISIGFMQWNWETKTLITDFFAQTSRDDIKAAPTSLQSDLKKLKDYADTNSPAKRQAASLVIGSWVTGAQGDPLVRGVRRSIRTALGTWLKTEEMKDVQLRLMNGVLGDAFFYARAWRRDTGSDKPVDARLVTYFFDLLTFNGGALGVWVPHVRQFRSTYTTGKATVDAVAVWLLSCQSFVSPNTQAKKLYALKDAVKSATYWKEKVQEKGDIYNDDQIDLLVLGLLRAQLSNGDDKPKGFHGVYQADVLTRRGVIAIGGYARGSQTPFIPF